MIYTTTMAENGTPQTDIVGREAAYLSVIEIGLGGLLHGLHVPFAGYFLSINQGFFLARAVRKTRDLERPRTVPLSISMIAATLKSLSPAGKKLTPMLGISMQGVLFTAGTVSLGPTLAGVVAGSALASVWAFLQPMLLYWILYGQRLVEIVRFYQDKFGLLLIFSALVVLKLVLSVGLGVVGYRLSDDRFESYRDRLVGAARAKRDVAAQSSTPGAPPQQGQGRVQSARGALRDLLNPLFLVSLALTAGFFVYSEASFAEIVWQLLRPVAMGFLLFFAVRRISFDPLLVHLERSRFRGFGKSLETALETVKRI